MVPATQFSPRMSAMLMELLLAEFIVAMVSQSLSSCATGLHGRHSETISITFLGSGHAGGGPPSPCGRRTPSSSISTYTQLDHAWLSAGFLLALRAPIGQNFMKRLMEDGSNDAALDSLMRSQFSRQ